MLTRGLASVAILVSLAMPAAAVSKSALAGFQETRWGESQSVAVRKFRAIYRQKGVTKNGVPFFSGTFGGYRDCYFYLWVNADLLHGVYIDIDPQDGKDTLETFVDVKKNLQKVYGKPTDFAANYYVGESGSRIDLSQTQDDATFNQLYHDLRSARAYLSAIWTFPDGNEIQLETDRRASAPGSAGYVNLIYRSPQTKAKADKAAERATLRDF